MAPRRTTFGKLQRDRAKKEKAAAKRERREEQLATATGDASIEASPEIERLPQEEVLARIEALHERFDDGAIAFDEFEQQKAALLASLAVD